MNPLLFLGPPICSLIGSHAFHRPTDDPTPWQRRRTLRIETQLQATSHPSQRHQVRSQLHREGHPMTKGNGVLVATVCSMDSRLDQIEWTQKEPQPKSMALNYHETTKMLDGSIDPTPPQQTAHSPDFRPVWCGHACVPPRPHRRRWSSPRRFSLTGHHSPSGRCQVDVRKT